MAHVDGLPMRPRARWEVVDLNHHDGSPTWRDSGWWLRRQALRRARSLALTRRAGVRDRRSGVVREVVPYVVSR